MLLLKKSGEIWRLVLVLLGLGEVVRCFQCPEYCICKSNNHGLRFVSCVGKHLISVDLGIPAKVQWLQLSHNGISILEDYVFKNLGLRSLVEINLDNNAIRYIGLRAFDGLRSLEAVDLSRNHLKTIIPWVFSENKALRVLKLSGNPFGFPKENQAFLASSSLQELDLSDCRLGHIPPYSFGLCSQLKYLNLSNNELVTLDDRILPSLHELETIDISGNKIICDSHISKINDWLKNKGVSFEGSPCIAEPFSMPNEKVKKFEELVVFEADEEEDASVGRDKSREFLQVPDEEYEEEIEDDKEESNNLKCRCDVDKAEKVSEIRLNIPLLLTGALSGGYILGALTIFMLLLIRKNCRRSRRGRCSVQLVRRESEAPPPYSMVIRQWNGY